MGCVCLAGSQQILQSCTAAAGRGTANHAKTQPVANLGDQFAVGVLADEHLDLDARRERSQQPFMPECVEKLFLRGVRGMLAAVQARDSNPQRADPAPNEECSDGSDEANQEWTAQFHERSFRGGCAEESWQQFAPEAIAGCPGYRRTQASNGDTLKFA